MGKKRTFTSLLDEIARTGDGFAGIWRERMHQAGYFKPVAARPDDIVAACNGLLMMLRTADERDAFSLPARMMRKRIDPSEFLLMCARRHRDRGVPVDLFLGCFKTMIQSLEEAILRLGIDAEDALAHILRIRKLADLLETAIVEDSEQTTTPDVTRRIEKNCRRLAIEKHRYENIYLNTTNMLMIANSEGVVVDANPQTHEVFAGHKVVGRPCGELLELDLRSLPAILQRYPLGKRHEIDINVDGDHRVFNLHVFPLEKTSDPTQGVMLVLNDITAIVETRLVLERRVNDQATGTADSERILEAIFQSVGEGIVLIDDDHEAVRANPQACEIFGLPEQNLKGVRVQSLTDPEGAETLTGFFRTLVEGEHMHAEISGCYVDGRSFPVAVTVTRIEYRGRTFWPMIVRDVTEQKEIEKRLQQEKRQTEEINLTLKNVLKTIEADRRQRERQVAVKVETSLLPALEKVAGTTDQGVRTTYLQLVRSQLVGLTSGYESELDAGLLTLTRTELEICRFIQAGHSGKEICDAMNLAFETIQTHRKNIRGKLGLKGKKINLRAFLTGRKCTAGTEAGVSGSTPSVRGLRNEEHSHVGRAL